MSFDRLLLESLDSIKPQILEERVSLSGNVDGVSYKTSIDPQRALFEIDVRSVNDGYLGTIEIDTERRKITFLNAKGKIVKTERGDKGPTEKVIKDYYVPTLISLVG